eukprot:UN17098
MQQNIIFFSINLHELKIDGIITLIRKMLLVKLENTPHIGILSLSSASKHIPCWSNYGANLMTETI